MQKSVNPKKKFIEIIYTTNLSTITQEIRKIIYRIFAFSLVHYSV